MYIKHNKPMRYINTCELKKKSDQKLVSKEWRLQISAINYHMYTLSLKLYVVLSSHVTPSSPD